MYNNTPSVFGIEHIIYLIIFISIFVGSIIGMRKFWKTDEQKKIVFMIFGFILLFFIIWNRIAISIRLENARYLIPNSFCGVTSLLLSLSLLFIKDKNHPIFHVLFYIGFIGGLLVTIYPDFIGQSSSIFYPATISGMIHHTLTLNIVILLAVSKEFKPALKKWWYLPLGLSVYMTWGIFLLYALNFSSAMQIDGPLIPDSIFTWYFVGALLIIAQIIFLFTYEYINNKNKKINYLLINEK